MTPEELLNTLINQSKHKIAGRDLKIIDNPDGTKGILFGNEGMQKSFTLYPKEKNFRKQDLAAKDYTEEIYNDNNPSASSFITKDEDWEDLRGSLQSYLKSGYDIVQNKDYLPNDLARIRKEKGIDLIGVDNTVRGESKVINKIKKEKPVAPLGYYDPTFDLTPGAKMSQTLSTLGTIGYNAGVKGAITLGETFYSMANIGSDLARGNTAPATKMLKDVASGVIGAATDATAATKAINKTIFDFFSGNETGGIEGFLNTYNGFKKVYEEGTNLDVLKYNTQEQVAAEETYNDSYLKGMEDLKTKVSYQAQQPKGPQDWSNWDFWEVNLAEGAQSAGEFSLPMIVSGGVSKIATGALMRGSGKIVGAGLERAARNMAKKKAISALDGPNMPKGISDLAKSSVARIGASLQDAQKMTDLGQKIGITGSTVASTKFEADLEGYHTYKGMMDEVQNKYAQDLLQQGLSEEEATKAIDDKDWSKEKEQARAAAEQTKNANYAILGLSNIATIKLLGLGPKSVVARGYAKANKANLDKLAPVTAALMKPWKERVVSGSTELLKEGWEELIQGSVSKYESNKGYEKDGLMDSLVGGTMHAINNLDNPESQAEFLSGMLGSGVTQTALSGFQKGVKYMSDVKQDAIYKKAFGQDVNKQINSILEPIRNSDNTLNQDAVRAHFIKAAQALNNDVAKDAANYIGDWQYGHVLEQEGFNKLYYEARENGIDHSSATEYILGALKARPQEQMHLAEHKTPFTEYKDKTTFMAEVEQGLARAQNVYDNMSKISRYFGQKKQELTPEKKQRVFEAIANHKEFMAINDMLLRNIKKDDFVKDKNVEALSPQEKLIYDQLNNKTEKGISEKIDLSIQKEAEKNIKLNQVYQNAYKGVIDDLLKEDDIADESIKYKAKKAAEAAEEAQVPVAEVVNQMTDDPKEAAKIIEHLDNEREFAAKSNLQDKTKLFLENANQLFTVGYNEIGQEMTPEALDELIRDYTQSVMDDAKVLGNQEKIIANAVSLAVKKGYNMFKENVGYLNIAKNPEGLKVRYEPSNNQRATFFVLERAYLADAMSKANLPEATAIYNANSAQDIIDTYQNASEKAKAFMEAHYAEGKIEQQDQITKPVEEMMSEENNTNEADVFLEHTSDIDGLVTKEDFEFFYKKTDCE